jgi:hypothetical protein
MRDRISGAGCSVLAEGPEGTDEGRSLAAWLGAARFAGCRAKATGSTVITATAAQRK